MRLNMTTKNVKIVLLFLSSTHTGISLEGCRETPPQHEAGMPAPELSAVRARESLSAICSAMNA